MSVVQVYLVCAILIALLAIPAVLRVFFSRKEGAGDRLSSGCPSCESQEWHRVFVTGPPGYGSVVPCNPASRKTGVPVWNERDIENLRSKR